jgi:hypothetical protein
MEHLMRGYQYTFLDMGERTEATLTLHLPSDEAASDSAKELLSKSKFAWLEMRKCTGTELIYPIDRTDCAKAF